MHPTDVEILPVLVPPAKADDRDLAARFARGEVGALEEVIERYQGHVAGLAARLLGWNEDAVDATQEVFVSALRGQRRFGARASLWTWLAAITVNRCRSIQRRRWLQHKLLRARGPAVEATESTERPGIEQDETALEVRAAIAELSRKNREVIVLHYLEELSIAEVAEILELRRNAVEVRLSRARKSLASALRHLARE